MISRVPYSRILEVPRHSQDEEGQHQAYADGDGIGRIIFHALEDDACALMILATKAGLPKEVPMIAATIVERPGAVSTMSAAARAALVAPATAAASVRLDPIRLG